MTKWIRLVLNSKTMRQIKHPAHERHMKQFFQLHEPECFPSQFSEQLRPPQYVPHIDDRSDLLIFAMMPAFTLLRIQMDILASGSIETNGKPWDPLNGCQSPLAKPSPKLSLPPSFRLRSICTHTIDRCVSLTVPVGEYTSKLAPQTRVMTELRTFLLHEKRALAYRHAPLCP